MSTTLPDRGRDPHGPATPGRLLELLRDLLLAERERRRDASPEGVGSSVDELLRDADAAARLDALSPFEAQAALRLLTGVIDTIRDPQGGRA